MVVTFPHMGTMHIVLEALFKGLGTEVLPPPPITKKTMDLGVKYAPETACLPLKITLGNFIEALEAGADTIATCGGVGPCRLGYYAAVQKNILEEMGFKFKMLVIEADIMDIWKKLRYVAPQQKWRNIYHAFHLAGAKMNALDSLEKRVNSLRPREKVRGTVDGIWQQAVQELWAVGTITGIEELLTVFSDKLNKITIKSGYQPLRIGVLGELYVLLEPFINFDIVRRLGHMGVEIHKTMFLSDYVQGHLLKERQHVKSCQQIVNLAMPYLGHYVGGHGIKSIGWAVQAGQDGLDGIIHVFPFTCMPEIIAKNILPQISRQKNIPILSLAFDEQSGEAGIVTRLEAFIDLLQYGRFKSAAKL